MPNIQFYRFLCAISKKSGGQTFNIARIPGLHKRDAVQELEVDPWSGASIKTHPVTSSVTNIPNIFARASFFFGGGGGGGRQSCAEKCPGVENDARRDGCLISGLLSLMQNFNKARRLGSGICVSTTAVQRRFHAI